MSDDPGLLGWDGSGQLVHEGQLAQPPEPIRRRAGGMRAGLKRAKRCDGCGVVFVPKREDQRYHSRACKQKAWRRRKRPAA